MKMPRAIKILVASITTALTVLNVSKKMNGKMKSASLFLLALVLCSCATTKAKHNVGR